jgi:hypothetical protein
MDQTYIQRPAKRSVVQELLDEEATKSKKSKYNTRLELARAKNRKEREYNNLLKSKARVSKAMEKMREHQSAHDVACDDIARLKALLKETDKMDLS